MMELMTATDTEVAGAFILAFDSSTIVSEGERKANKRVLTHWGHLYVPYYS